MTIEPEDQAKLDLALIAATAAEDHVWIVSQKVRNKARAIILLILFVAMAGIYARQEIQNRYLQERREVGEQRQADLVARLSADEYAACQSLQRSGQTSTDPTSPWIILNCASALAGPVPSSPGPMPSVSRTPGATSTPSPSLPRLSAVPGTTGATPGPGALQAPDTAPVAPSVSVTPTSSPTAAPSAVPSPTPSPRPTRPVTTPSPLLSLCAIGLICVEL